MTAHKVNSVDIENNVLMVNHESVSYENLIIATPSYITADLLQPHAAFAEASNRLMQLQYEPVCTVYLQYPQQIRLPLPMIGCINASGEWLFDRTHCNQPGLISVVISANGPHIAWSNDELINRISKELAQLFPDWPKHDTAQVIREKRACFCCTINIDAMRPAIRTAVNNIKLCGDYVYIEDNFLPGLPATLEGAVRSGVKCAQQTLQDMHSCNT